MSPDVVSLVSTDKTRTGGISESKWAYKEPWTREPVTARTVLFLESKDLGRLPLEKILWTWWREENARSSPDGSLFVERGGGGGMERQEETSQSSAWQCVWLEDHLARPPCWSSPVAYQPPSLGVVLGRRWGVRGSSPGKFFSFKVAQPPKI